MILSLASDIIFTICKFKGRAMPFQDRRKQIYEKLVSQAPDSPIRYQYRFTGDDLAYQSHCRYVFIMIGVFSGLYSMVVFILGAMRTLDAIEKQHSDKKEETKTK